MPQNDLFTFTYPVKEDDIVRSNIKLNPFHRIFEAHFPNNPVLPGACMMQMVKQVAEAYTDKKIKLLIGHDLKFLSLIKPEGNPGIQIELKINIEDEKIRVTAQLTSDGIVFFKFKGTFVQL